MITTKATKKIKIAHLFNGDRRFSSEHTVTTARGLIRLYRATASGNGWGVRVEISRADAIALGAYHGCICGNMWFPVDGADPIPLTIKEPR